MRKVLGSKLIFGKYRIKNLIAKGTFGEVYQGINILDKKSYALKFEEAQHEISVLREETYILMLLKGPGIPSVISYGKKDRYGNEKIANNFKKIVPNAKIKIVDILHAFVLGYSQDMFNAIVDMINDDLNSK